MKYFLKCLANVNNFILALADTSKHCIFRKFIVNNSRCKHIFYIIMNFVAAFLPD